MEKITSTLRLRMSAKDAHYGGELVDGAHMVHLFGDVATELLIKLDGEECNSGVSCDADFDQKIGIKLLGEHGKNQGTWKSNKLSDQKGK